MAARLPAPPRNNLVRSSAGDATSRLAPENA
jgi:hypothetical protein